MEGFDLVIGGVAIIPIVLGLVEIAKKLDIGGKGAFILALLLGVFFSILAGLVDMYPVISPWVNLVVRGLIGGLSATGLYDLAKKMTSKPLG